MITVINVTDIQNGKASAALFMFHISAFISYIFFQFLLLNDEYILLIAAEIDS